MIRCCSADDAPLALRVNGRCLVVITAKILVFFSSAILLWKERRGGGGGGGGGRGGGVEPRRAAWMDGWTERGMEEVETE